MKKTNQVKILFEKIFGDKIRSIDFKNYTSSTPIQSSINDKCKLCGSKCASFSMIQDLPFFEDIEEVETIVIGEAPGNGIDDGTLGYVFGWNDWNNPKSRKNLSYRNFFFSHLDMTPRKTYITDGVKCYTSKTDFKSVFKNCHVYLEQEISIIRPQKIIIISKQLSLRKFLEKIQAKYNFDLLQIPHPSNQNLSKIKTVAEIFMKVGETSKNEDWIKLGKSIEYEYLKLREELAQE